MGFFLAESKTFCPAPSSRFTFLWTSNTFLLTCHTQISVQTVVVVVVSLFKTIYINFFYQVLCITKKWCRLHWCRGATPAQYGYRVNALLRGTRATKALSMYVDLWSVYRWRGDLNGLDTGSDVITRTKFRMNEGLGVAQEFIYYFFLMKHHYSFMVFNMFIKSDLLWITI